eukprot:3506144-Amphidinium_carterae.1
MLVLNPDGLQQTRFKFEIESKLIKYAASATVILCAPQICAKEGDFCAPLSIILNCSCTPVDNSSR